MEACLQAVTSRNWKELGRTLEAYTQIPYDDRDINDVIDDYYELADHIVDTPLFTIPDVIELAVLYKMIHQGMLCAGITDYVENCQELVSKCRQRMKNFFRTPYNDMDITLYDAPLFYRIAYMRFSYEQRLPIPLAEILRATDDILRADRFDLLDQMSVIVTHCSDMYELHPDFSAWCALKREFLSRVRAYIGDPPAQRVYHPRTVAFYIRSSNAWSADRRCANAFVTAVRRAGYCTVLVHSNPDTVLAEDDIFDDMVVLPSPSLESVREVLSNEYEYAFYVTHSNIWANILAHYRYGRTQCMILGHPITTAVPEIDYVVTTDWDDNSHYTEKRVNVATPAGSMTIYPANFPAITPTRDPKDVLIFCPWSVSKFSHEAGKMLNTIQQRLKLHGHNPRFLFHITGTNMFEKFHAKFTEFVEPYIDDYTTSSGDLAQFYQFINVADIAILATPYTGYTTVIDALQAQTPIFAIDNKSHYITRIGAEILRATGHEQFVAETVDDLATKIVRYVDADMPALDFNIEEFIKQNNELIEQQFYEWFVINSST